ncbi:MAG: chemotaxis protein CheW [Candidatus Omnitrophica bacterium]|nr:chemotaxis protein CheW [Candidatus Omnitrophota bacterium]
MPEKKMLELVSFKVGESLFVLPIQYIQEIIRLTAVVAIPKSPDFMEGVINLRGKVIPVIDLRKRFGIEGTIQGSQGRIIITEVEDFMVGLQVDSVSEVVKANADELEKTPSFITGIDHNFVEGIIKHGDTMFILLTIDNILTSSETEILKDVK